MPRGDTSSCMVMIWRLCAWFIIDTSPLVGSTWRSSLESVSIHIRTNPRFPHAITFILDWKRRIPFSERYFWLMAFCILFSSVHDTPHHQSWVDGFVSTRWLLFSFHDCLFDWQIFNLNDALHHTIMMKRSTIRSRTVKSQLWSHEKLMVPIFKTPAISLSVHRYVGLLCRAMPLQ